MPKKNKITLEPTTPIPTIQEQMEAVLIASKCFNLPQIYSAFRDVSKLSPASLSSVSSTLYRSAKYRALIASAVNIIQTEFIEHDLFAKAGKHRKTEKAMTEAVAGIGKEKENADECKALQISPIGAGNGIIGGVARTKEDVEKELNELANQTNDPKLKADILKQITDLKGFKNEQKIDNEIIRYYLPLSCRDCALYKSAAEDLEKDPNETLINQSVTNW